MERLIDACKLQNEYKNRHDGKRLLLIDVAPTVDAVPVVRCKNCKYWITNNYYHSCGLLNIVVNNGDFFCADGEREGGDEHEQSCETCIHYPPSSLDGKPCCFCETSDPVTNCWERRNENAE